MRFSKRWATALLILIASLPATTLYHSNLRASSKPLSAPSVSTVPLYIVSLDAISLSQTDVSISSSASQSKSFRIGAVINSSAANPLTGIYGWEFQIGYNASAFIPRGDPSLSSSYPDGAAPTALYGAQTAPGTINWAAKISSGQAFAGTTIIDSPQCSHSPCQFREFDVFLALLAPNPAVSLSANTLLANVNFELLNKPSTPQNFNVTKAKFVNIDANPIPGPVAGSPAIETITNAPPIATFLISRTPQIGPFAFSFNASGSHDPDGTIPNPTGYFWDFGDSSQDLGVNGTIVSHDYGMDGNFNVTLRVQDNLGATGSARDALGTPIVDSQPSHARLTARSLTDTPPTAAFTFSSKTPSNLFDFNAAASTDPDGIIVSYNWQFGDGSPNANFSSTASETTHLFQSPGNYTVTLTVVDDVNLTGTISHVVTNTVLMHDVALLSVSAYPSIVHASQAVQIGIAIANHGSSNETVSVTAYYGSNVIGTLNGIFLPAPTANCYYCGYAFFQIAWDTTGVSAGNYTISATVFLPTDQNPSDNSMTDGKVQVLPPPTLAVNPSSGVSGTTVTVHGANFPNPYFPYVNRPSSVIVSFDDQLIGFATAQNGTFNFTFSIPLTQQGPHLIKALADTGAHVSTVFQVLPAPSPATLAVNVHMGQIYFPSDTVVIYTQVVLNGQSTVPSNLQLQLFLPNGTSVILTAQSIGPGLFKSTWAVPKSGPSGTYLVVVKVHTIAPLDATSSASFEVKPSWLNQGGKTVIAGVSAAAVFGLAIVAWKRGYFRKQDDTIPS